MSYTFHTVPPPDRELRRRSVGASEAPSVLGVGFDSAIALYREKVALLEEDLEIGKRDQVRVGNYLENGLIDFAADEMDAVTVRSRQEVFRRPNLYVHATSDAILEMRTGPDVYVEAKARGGFTSRDWGDPGTDQIPDAVLIQCQVGMHLSGCTLAVVPLVTYGHELRLYRVEYDQELAEAIVQACHEWYLRHVLTRVEPPAAKTVTSWSALKRTHREGGLEQEVPGELIRRFQFARALRLELEKREDELKRRIVEAGGIAEVFVSDDDPEARATYYETKRRGYVVEDTSYRQLNVRSAEGAEALARESAQALLSTSLLTGGLVLPEPGGDP